MNNDRITPQDLLELMKRRRSIRTYKNQPVPREYIEMILEAARWAPSGENFQPWHFIVTQDRNTIREIGLIGARASGRRFLMEYLSGELGKRLAAIPKEKRDRVIRRLVEGEVSGFVADAPMLITFCTRIGEGVDTPMDLAAAAQNALLMAEALGLGACWVIGPCKDPRDQKKVRRVLKVPDDYYVYFVLCAGFPNESPRPRPRKPLSEIVSYDIFQKNCVQAGA